MTSHLIIFAAWIEWIGPVILFILYSLAQLLTAKGQKPPQRPQRPRVPVEDGPPLPQQQPRTLEEKLRKEVEEFLRRVQGDEPADRPVAKPQRPVVVRVEPTTVVVPESNMSRETVGEYVAKHLRPDAVVQHAATLGAEVGHADEKMQAHLQQKFQHQVGALEPRQTIPQFRQRSNTTAAEIAALLSSPKGVRQIIIASEILRRPEI